MSEHTCHWPGCDKAVPPKLWGCREHWFKLPKILRDKIWKTYVPGQEVTKTPSLEYVAAAREVRDWIIEYQKNVTVDLFGKETKPVLYTKDGRAMKPGPQGGKHYVQPRGYGGRPGTGPKDETCGTCKNCYRKRMGKTYIKCLLAQASWTGGRGTDILARTAACDKWEKKDA